MPKQDKSLESLKEADLLSLVANRVAEQKTIGYKSSLPGGSDDERHEFLADVSSFANAAGGVLLYGIEKADGVPGKVNGLANVDVGATIRDLEHRVRDGISPRISVEMRDIKLRNGNVVLMMHIRKSWTGPHITTANNWSGFFSRNSNGKYPLNIDELRAAFARSEATVERIRDFRRERVATILSGETPFSHHTGAKIMLLLVPFAAYDTGVRFDLASLEHRGEPYPLHRGVSYSRHNFDGYLKVAERQNKSNGPYETEGYVQVFRNGSIEAADAHILQNDRQSGKTIPSELFEQAIVERLPSYLAVQKSLGVQPPIALMLTLTGVRGYEMRGQRAVGDYYNPIERDILDIPEIILDDYIVTPETAAQTMRPLFDVIWNATGYPRSMNFDANGYWHGLVS